MLASNPYNPRVIGLSALGNNFVEGTADGHTPVEDTTLKDVPLVFDEITGTWCAKLSRVHQEERIQGLEVAQVMNEDQRFLSLIGYQQK